MIYGWGTQHVTRQLGDGTQVTCRYRYVSLLFIFSLVWSRRWFLQGRDRAMDREITPDEIEQIFGPGSVPSPGLWRRFGALMSLAVLVSAAAVSAAIGSVSGTTGPTEAVAEPVAEVASELSSEPADDPEGRNELDDDLSGNDGGDGAVDAGEDGAQSTPPGTTSARLQQVATSIEMTSNSALISTDPNDPVEEIGEITIDAIFSTDGTYAGVTPQPGSKLIITDFHVLINPVTSTGGGGANFGDEVFRIVTDDGRIYQSVENWHEFAQPGFVFNRSLVVEVPVDVTAFEFQIGVPPDQPDGYTARFDVELGDGPIAAFLPSDAPIVEGSVAAAQTSENNIGNGSAADAYSKLPATEIASTVLDGRVAAKLGPDAADPGFKWLILSLQIEGVTPSASFSSDTVRLEADSELYSPKNNVSEFIRAGEVIGIEMVFQIPANAAEAMLEVGSPENWLGERATFQLDLP